MRQLLIALVIAGCGGSDKAAALTRDEIARACVNAYGCLAPPVDGPTLPGCLGKLDDDDGVVSMYRPEQVQCLAAAGANCTAVRACVGYAYGPCSPDTRHCEGDKLIECGGGSGFSLDCRNGLWFTGETTCVAAGTASCGLGPCTDGTPDRCDGTHAVRCRSGVLESFDCGRYGTTCALDNGNATCAGTGPACTASRCEGNQLIRCQAGRELHLACDQMLAGGTCVPTGRGGASCAFGTACVEGATCAGTATQVCVLGAQLTIDCIATGFHSCDQGSCVPATFP